MTADRILGGAVALFGVFLLLWGIPDNVKTVPGIFVYPNPALFPQLAAALLVALGVMQMVFTKTNADVPSFARIALFLAVAGATLVAMVGIRAFGYLPVAIALMILICIITGERRPLWLATVVIGLPVGTWLFFEQILSRPLP
ncbi:tripartite tricarboxylate transporter TctB family protein [Martelella sp. AMO21009]